MIYLLFGEEDYLISEEVARFKKQFKEDSFEKFDSIKVADLIESLKTPGLFSPNRLIVVYNLDLEEDEELLCDTLKEIDPGIKLVIVSPLNLDRRKKIFKVISSVGETKEFKPYSDWEINGLVSWLTEQVKSRSKDISPANAELLAGISGKNLFSLKNEIEKILTYIGQRKEISREDILLLASQKDAHAFSFVDALKEKNVALALFLEERILLDRSSIVPLLSLIASQFRVLLCVKLMQAGRMDYSAIGKKLSYGPFYVKKCMEQARRFSLKRLREILELLYRSDLDLKKGESDRVILPLLTEEICRG